MRFSKAVVKYRVAILIVALVLLVPAVFGMVNTRINYDMLDFICTFQNFLFYRCCEAHLPTLTKRNSVVLGEGFNLITNGSIVFNDIIKVFIDFFRTRQKSCNYFSKFFFREKVLYFTIW